MCCAMLGTGNHALRLSLPVRALLLIYHKSGPQARTIAADLLALQSSDQL